MKFEHAGPYANFTIGSTTYIKYNIQYVKILYRCNYCNKFFSYAQMFSQGQHPKCPHCKNKLIKDEI